MEWQNSIPTHLPKQRDQVILLEAELGQSRRDLIQQWLKKIQYGGAATWFLSCDREEGGPWAGLNDLLNNLVPQIQLHAPDLITKHDYELVHVLPALRRTIPVRHLSLTDAPPPGEPHLIYYPPDRALRLVHGVINLLKDWQQRSDGSPWVIACDRYDRTSTLVRYFFAQLMRRAGEQLHLTLLLATDIEASETVASQFDPKYLAQCVRLNLPPDPTIPVSPQEMAQLAQKLANQVEKDEIEQESNLPKLIRYYLLGDQPEKALNYQIQACSVYAKQGYYNDAMEYGEAALAHLERHCPDDGQKRWKISEKLHDVYISLSKPDLALQIIKNAMAKTDEPDCLFQGCNRMAMLYARYLHNNLDLAKAEAYLQRGLQELERANLPEEIKFYKTAVNHRALALIRYSQGQFAEVEKICLSTYEETISRLGADKYQNHQAVLMSNLSRIYASSNLYDKAITYLSSAIDLDPHYSEYYNQRANLYLKMGRLDDARNDYLKAIELSPPYPEVWTNLAQCYRLRGQMAEAVDAYSTSLDLDPNQSLALVGRAQALELLEQPDAALEDYSAAIALNSNQPLVLANRAILHYDAGRYQEAFNDLNLAIALSPENPEFYQNRAVALIALSRFEEATQDLATYLRLKPDADDRSEVERKLFALETDR